MPNFKPCVSTADQRMKPYKTYALLKKDLRKLIESTPDNQVMVSRSRRGEWGEWFEYWRICSNGKLVIFKQGWM